MSKCSCQHKCLNASNQEQEEKAKETDSGYKKYGIKDQLRAEFKYILQQKSAQLNFTNMNITCFQFSNSQNGTDSIRICRHIHAIVFLSTTRKVPVSRAAELLPLPLHTSPPQAEAEWGGGGTNYDGEPKEKYMITESI